MPRVDRPSSRYCSGNRDKAFEDRQRIRSDNDDNSRAWRCQTVAEPLCLSARSVRQDSYEHSQQGLVGQTCVEGGLDNETQERIRIRHPRRPWRSETKSSALRRFCCVGRREFPRTIAQPRSRGLHTRRVDRVGTPPTRARHVESQRGRGVVEFIRAITFDEVSDMEFHPAPLTRRTERCLIHAPSDERPGRMLRLPGAWVLVYDSAYVLIRLFTFASRVGASNQRAPPHAYYIDNFCLKATTARTNYQQLENDDGG